MAGLSELPRDPALTSSLVSSISVSSVLRSLSRAFCSCCRESAVVRARPLASARLRYAPHANTYPPRGNVKGNRHLQRQHACVGLAGHVLEHPDFDLPMMPAIKLGGLVSSHLGNIRRPPSTRSAALARVAGAQGAAVVRASRERCLHTGLQALLTHTAVSGDHVGCHQRAAGDVGAPSIPRASASRPTAEAPGHQPKASKEARLTWMV